FIACWWPALSAALCVTWLRSRRAFVAKTDPHWPSGWPACGARSPPCRVPKRRCGCIRSCSAACGFSNGRSRAACLGHRFTCWSRTIRNCKQSLAKGRGLGRTPFPRPQESPLRPFRHESITLLKNLPPPPWRSRTSRVSPHRTVPSRDGLLERTIRMNASSCLQGRFLTLLPRIEKVARYHFRDQRCPNQKADRIAEVIALAWKWFVELEQRGKEVARFVSVLASLAARAVRSGRRLAGMEPAQDVLSGRAQQRRGFQGISLPA